MRNYRPSFLPERNPVTHKAHRREVLRQITLPLITGILLILAVAVLFVVMAVQGQDQTVSKWGDISLIWLVVPTMLIVLIMIVLFAGLAYITIKLIQVLPRYFLQLQNLVATIGMKVRHLADALVEPIIKIRAFAAALQNLRERL